MATTTSASVGKHPLHAILVAFPIGLWMFSLYQSSLRTR
jgi:uncharacterized membrane protein